MKRFASIEEKRAYNRETQRRYMARKRALGQAYYEHEQPIDICAEAKRMHADGVPLVMIWASLNVSMKELADILQIRVTPKDKHYFFESH